MIWLALVGCLFLQEPPAVPTLSTARQKYMEGRYAEAIEDFRLLAGDRDNVSAGSPNGQNTGEQRPIEQGSSKPPADPKTRLEASLGLARCQLMIGQYEQGLQELLKLQAQESAEWHFLLAQFRLRIGKYDEAIEGLRQAIKINAQHAGARKLLGDTLEMIGRRDEAIETYRWFDEQIAGRADLPRDPAWVTAAAIGLYRYSVLTQTDVPRRTQHVLNEMLQPVYGRLDRGFWPARLAAADLLREKHNDDEHDGSVSDYQAALKINPNLPDAHVGLGLVALDAWDFEEIEQRVQKALEINPRFAPALNLDAARLILERRYAEVAEPCDRALAINPKDLHALSLKAAAAACRYDRSVVDEIERQVAAINPTCALFHRTVADALSGIRQYAASEAEYRKAIEFDPTDANARTELGMMYMQWGEEAKAREALDGAWALDPYNERTKFTLDLLDRLHKFDTHETEHFIIRYDAKNDPNLGPIVADYLEPIYSAVTTDFETPLTQKTIIEFFPTHKAFAVRITGKPWIHTVGACTGRLIALATPRDDPQLMGRYNLARVLKHEFTHTITLAATENRIPHWFTEGLAVYQEDTPRPFEWSGLLANAVRQNRLFTLASIDWGFMRPQRPTDRQMAYAQSEWMCEFIVSRWGYEIILPMLRAYRDGRTQPQVLRELLKIEPEDFDREFASWAHEQVKSWGFDLTPSGNLEELRAKAAQEGVGADILGKLAHAAFENDSEDEAIAAAKRALAMDENQRDALEVIVTVLKIAADGIRSESDKRRVDDEALPYLDRFIKVDPRSWIAWKYLGEIAMRRGKLEQAAQAWSELQRLCPADPASWRGLAGIALQKKDEISALPQLMELAHIEQHDPQVPAKIGEILRKQGKVREAIYWYRQALAIDPLSPALHRALGDTFAQLADWAGALKEYQRVLAVQPNEVKVLESAAIAAGKLGDSDEARRLARRALALDPLTTVKPMAEEK